MTEPNDFPENDPRHHTLRMRGVLKQLIEHARGDVDKVDEPKAQALFETIAEVCEDFNVSGPVGEYYSSKYASVGTGDRAVVSVDWRSGCS